MTNISLSHFQSAAESAAISGNLNQKLTVTDGGDLQTREASSTLAGKLVSWHKLSSSEGTAKAQDQGAFRTALQDKFGKELGDQAYKHACTACGYTDGKAHSLTAEQITTGIDFAVRHKHEAEAQNKSIIEYFKQNPEQLLTVGLTRVNGSKNEINKLIANRTSQDFDNNVHGKVEHELAGAFKQNLRDNMSDTELAKVLDFVKSYDPVLENLPALNGLPEMVQDTVKFSAMIANKADVNKMQPSNLSIVFGPNVVKDDSLAPMEQIGLIEVGNKFFAALVERELPDDYYLRIPKND
ncbi:RhoGAP domain protein [Pseudovibrio sp. Ad5]|uniref:Rho GTPase-activating protein n=1 Tax=Pseudovibrio sp. Ad5 TaxID=989436 RepID=UPI0007AE8219|nr:Rho GTPase-activating protein [Pseudovibrio sp. Ad5]KZL01988.1 RhoGAP domain protein [Pseudovibrio sp. Ad5]